MDGSAKAGRGAGKKQSYRPRNCESQVLRRELLVDDALLEAVLTPISAFRPRRWRGALLPAQARVKFEILEHRKRPVSTVADYSEVRDVVEVTVEEKRDTELKILFDPEHSLEERIINEQFTP